MKQLFLNRERIACMFLCVCARAVCVCNLSLFVRKAFLPPHRSGSPLSAVLTHLFHFACIALAPSPSSLLLRSLAFFPLCHLPHPSPRLVSPLLLRLLFSPKKKSNVTVLSRSSLGFLVVRWPSPPPWRRVGKAILREIYHRSNDFLQTSRIAFPPAESHPLSPIYNSPFILFHFQYFSHSAAL